MIVYFGDDIIVKTKENFIVRDGETNTLEGEQFLFYKNIFFEQ